MHDDFDDMLSGLARAVGSNVQPPPGQNLRQRSARHVARRRMTASVLTVALVGLAGSAAAIVVSNGNAHKPSTSNTTSHTPTGHAPSTSVSPTPSTSRTASPNPSGSTAQTTPGSANQGIGTTSPAAPPNTGATNTSGSDTPAWTQLEGLWKPADGEERALVVLASGDVGIGQAGGVFYPMCYSVIGMESDGAFPLTMDCGDWGTSGLSLSLSGADLILHVPAANGSPATQVTWVRVPTPAVLPGDGIAMPSWLIGSWADSGDPAGETFAISAHGNLSWTLVTQSGQTESGTGTVDAIGNGQYIGWTTLGGDNEFWVFSGLDSGQMQVISGYATLYFNKTAN
jgi:hypothetical protein